jgi:hypothetical protein
MRVNNNMRFNGIYNSIMNEAVKSKLKDSEYLQNLAINDQKERNKYKEFAIEHGAQSQQDWENVAKLYAKQHKRQLDDLFNERTKLLDFTSRKFNYNNFSKKDWQNYWLLAQHCDFNRSFQKSALNRIEKHLGKNTEQYKYLSDRISCGETGRQVFGTQDLCNKD